MVARVECIIGNAAHRAAATLSYIALLITVLIDS